MTKKTFRFGTAIVDYHFGGSFATLRQLTDPRTTVLLTDEHVFGAHEKRFKGWNSIVLKPGEAYKVQETVDAVIGRLIELGADRKWTLVGIGGGVVSDLAGYIAAIYLRGIRCGFVPTTLLALVDASIGGKNGIDVGPFKNMVGTIRQPAFLLHDLSMLQSLPEAEWRNGFAEIIKHAAIRDAPMFRELEAGSPAGFRKKKAALAALVQRNALLKTKVVLADEFEAGERRLLNFGHTLGHALENQYELAHGEAVAIGMTFAARLSQQRTGFRGTERLVGLIDRYGLPTDATYKKEKVLPVLARDKKKEGGAVHFVLLQRIGKALVEPIPLNELSELL
ncbi:MAG: 3-dehydroquinate synthase [Chitinophagaceae bacterium]|nr:MAG: 3-dehydroquinate synthase [Chitinophagaceae bacterium]